MNNATLFHYWIVSAQLSIFVLFSMRKKSPMKIETNVQVCGHFWDTIPIDVFVLILVYAFLLTWMLHIAKISLTLSSLNGFLWSFPIAEYILTILNWIWAEIFLENERKNCDLTAETISNAVSWFAFEQIAYIAHQKWKMASIETASIPTTSTIGLSCVRLKHYLHYW